MQVTITRVKGADGKDKDVITIVADIEPRISSTGKTRVIASSGGNMSTTMEYAGRTVLVGFNAYTKNTPAEVAVEQAKIAAAVAKAEAEAADAMDAAADAQVKADEAKIRTANKP